jgi:hypothetical protein
MTDFLNWSVSELRAFLAREVNVDLSNRADRNTMIGKLVDASNVRPWIADYLSALMPLARLTVPQLRAVAREWTFTIVLKRKKWFIDSSLPEDLPHEPCCTILCKREEHSIYSSLRKDCLLSHYLVSGFKKWNCMHSVSTIRPYSVFKISCWVGKFLFLDFVHSMLWSHEKSLYSTLCTVLLSSAS